jgi:2-(1,2-epoxy-1,2-dihydrophenyl)acetyl-CoA isomerase
MGYITFTVEEGVGRIDLNRPEKYNSFVREMAMAFQEILDVCAVDSQVRAVYITGNGKAFSAGQDLQEAIDADGPGLERIVKEHYNPLVRKLRLLEKPVVAAVNGVAAGAGANLALACDVVVASESASFIQAFSKIGLIPDSGGTFMLPRLIGLQRAAALMMLGDRVTGREAEAMGMIYKCYADEQFEASSMALAKKLASMPTRALWLTKKALNQSLVQGLDDQLILEDQLQTEAGKTADYAEGVNAFLEKRPPVFKGE